MKVKDVMTADQLGFCSPETKLRKAAKAMKTCNCGALPVVDGSKKVVGIITDRDICLSLAQKKSTRLKKTRVGQIMPKELHTVNVDDDISTAYKEMRTNQIGRLPVTDENGILRGIISLHNLINKSLSNGKANLGSISSKDENLLKTINAVTNRYNKHSIKKKKITLKKAKA